MSAALVLIAALGVGLEVESEDPKVAEKVEEVAERLSKVRQLESKKLIRVGVLDRKRLEVKLMKELDEELPPKKAQAEAAVLVRLGLIPEEMDFREFIRDLHLEQVGGFYDDEEEKLYLIREEPGEDEEDEMVIAHELTHALQDQNYGLARLVDPLEEEGDMELAVRALVEGDATVAMIEYMISVEEAGPLRAFLMRTTTDLLMSNAGLLMRLLGVGEDTFSQAPNVVKEELLFPYSKGLAFVRYGIRNDRWSVLDDAYKNPPLSTEQILHPAKYFKTPDWPTQIITPRVGVLLPGKWHSVSRTVAGELGIRVLLAEHRPAEEGETREVPSPSRAAAGWDGDEIRAYRDRDNPDAVMLLWYSTWDSEDDASEFAQALSVWATARHEDARPVKGHADRWTVGENQIRVQRHGRDVLLLDAPNPEHHDAIVEAVRAKTWKKEVRRTEDIE
jgi:hypothetical protein